MERALELQPQHLAGLCRPAALQEKPKLHAEAAVALEAAIAAGDASEIDRCAARFEGALAEVLEACGAFVEPAGAPEAQADRIEHASEQEPLERSLRQLAEMLRENRSAAVLLFRSLRERLSARGGAELTEQLGAQIERLDFEAAGRTLRSVAGALETID